MKRIFILLPIAWVAVTCSAPDTGTAKVASKTSVEQPQVESVTRADAGSSARLKNDLLKYNGFYTAVEMEGGAINPANLPEAVAGGKDVKPDKVDIQYLTKHQHGFILVFNMRYDKKVQLVVATLDRQFEMKDFVQYPNGNGNVDPGEDTVTFLSYDRNRITVELMRPNPEEEPMFEVDGIYREELTITDALEIEK